MKLISRILTAVLLLSLGMNATAQNSNDPVIFEIGNQKILKSEFMKEFLKSIGKDPSAAPTACTYEKRKALEDYVDVYVNFRAKLADAYAMRLDTLYSLRKELKGYRTELAAPYLIDSATMEKVLREAYDRNHYAIHASHILIRIDRNTDTIEAYRKAMEVYNKAVSGEDFATLAVTYSDDPSAKGLLGGEGESANKGNKGDLGNFTVFNMVYPFENGAYNTAPGEISKPIRSTYGYHIIKVHDKIPYFGKSTIQHIWIRDDGKSTYPEFKAKEAYQRMKDGESFAQICKNYSDDRSSMDNGGLLPDLDMSQMPAEYLKAISNTPMGEYCEPFHTSFGWHIVKVVKKETIPSYENMVPFYKQRLSRDTRNNAPKEAYAKQCKERYGFTDFTKMYEKQAVKTKNGKKVQPSKQPKVYLASLDNAIAAMNDSIYHNKWRYRASMVTDTRPLCLIDDKEYTTADFLKYMESHQTTMRDKSNIPTLINTRYEEFTDDMALGVADKNLEKENAEFRDLINEYRSGLMIFSYTDRMVWSKAIKDTTGLKEFYERESKKRSLDNPEDEPYFWNTRAQVKTVTVSDSAALPPAKAIKIINKCQKKGIDNLGLQSQLAEAATKKDTTNKVVKVDPVTVEEGNQNLLAKNEWKPATYVHPNQKGYTILVVEKIIDPCLKSVMEARGYYINDYQNYLDAELIKTLRQKYNVVIHQDVVDEITY
jgi:peptidyl-prolyl cis-trans isomerase SurA